MIQEPPVLSSKQEVARLISISKTSGINTLYVQVYRAGELYLPQDSLDYLIREAHGAGIEVYAWFNLLSLGANTRAALLQQYGPDILTRNAREKKSLADYRIDNQYFLEPGDLRVREAVKEVVREVLNRYPGLDGVLYDYIRYPDLDPKYGRTPANIERYQKATGAAMIADESASWKNWKRKQVTEFLEELVQMTRSLRPKITVAATGCAPYSRAYEEAYQDWPSWIRQNLVDFVLFMDYAADVKEYSRYLEDAKKEVADFHKVYLTVCAYKLTHAPQVFARECQIAGQSGAGQTVIFHYGDILEYKGLRKELKV